MIHLICDSTAAVPREMLAARPNLHVIPMQICMDGKYVEEYNTTIDAVIEYSERTKKSVPTSQPSTGDFLAAFEKIPADDPIIVLALTSAVSGTYNGAVLAVKQSGRKQIAAIDSRTTAIGMVQLLEDAFEWIDAGLSFEEVRDRLMAATFRSHTSFTIATLDYLYRGGRIGRAANLVSSILKIRPVIYIDKDNQVNALDKVRTEKKGIARLLKFLADNSPAKRIGVVHLQAEAGANELAATIRETYPGVPVTVTTGTPVLSAYLGPGLIGIIFESAE